MCLYTGLVSDTGRFQYESTTPEVFALAQELVALRPAHPRASAASCSRSTASPTCARRRGLGRAELDATRRFVWRWVTADDLAATASTLEETEGLIDLRAAHGQEADVACVLKETPEGMRVSLRPVPRSTSRPSPRALGGGGHRYAAGFTVRRPRPGRRSRHPGASIAVPVADRWPTAVTDGLVVVDKPAGLDVPRRRRPSCRRIFGTARIGHAGTLDPDATGVLLVGWAGPPACSAS